ncbi:MAG: APC family permease [Holosporaceae bacterium]|jgi:amino acid transporter|nr:APC family permease [Holosporaceae bacterium]
MSLSSFVFGNPLKSEAIVDARFSKTKALAVFSSDVLSSISYATEEILLVLGIALTHSFALPISGAIVVLILLVSVSYWQTIEAYPGGGGAFTVVHENLGEFCGLVAASALLVDYTLTVAVSLAVGARALASMLPTLGASPLLFCMVSLSLITFANLRGVKEFSRFFVVPTYCFVGLAFLMIIVGLGGAHSSASRAGSMMPSNAGDELSGLLVAMMLVKAFAYGSSVLTGIEAIANGVTAFRKPQYRNAQATLVVMACALALLFPGLTFVACKYGIFFSADETVISQIARRLFGSGIIYYLIQLATICVLLIAANSAFAGFPRLASVLAKKRYIPTSFANLGDRLAYSNGILMLALVSSLLVVKFRADSFALITLYSIGVFISLILSQSGMVVHWLRVRGKNWHIKVAVNAIGATATMVTLLVIVESNFLDGAWIILCMIPVLFFIFRKISARYGVVNLELDLKKGGLGKLLHSSKEASPRVVVPISRMHKGTLAALRFALSLSRDVVAVTVNIDQREVDRLKLTWRSMNFQIPLVILKSPYRSVVNPFLDFLEEQDEQGQESGKAIVVMPSFVPGKMWQNILHNQTAAIFKTALLYRKRESEQTRIIVEIPYQMRF